MDEDSGNEGDLESGVDSDDDKTACNPADAKTELSGLGGTSCFMETDN